MDLTSPHPCVICSYKFLKTKTPVKIKIYRIGELLIEKKFLSKEQHDDENMNDLRKKIRASFSQDLQHRLKYIARNAFPITDEACSCLKRMVLRKKRSNDFEKKSDPASPKDSVNPRKTSNGRTEEVSSAEVVQAREESEKNTLNGLKTKESNPLIKLEDISSKIAPVQLELLQGKVQLEAQSKSKEFDKNEEETAVSKEVVKEASKLGRKNRLEETKKRKQASLSEETLFTDEPSTTRTDHKNYNSLKIRFLEDMSKKSPEELKDSLGCFRDQQCENYTSKISCNDGNCSLPAFLCANRVFKPPKRAGGWEKATDKKDSLKVSSAGPKGQGLFTSELIPEGSFIVEYVGEYKITSRALNNDDFLAYLYNCLSGSHIKSAHTYKLSIGNNVYIDAAVSRSTLGRLINHSCDPNAFIEMWMVNDQPKIGIFALKDIQAGEEITFDYKLTSGSNLVSSSDEIDPMSEIFVCKCGSEKCRGSLNTLSKKEAFVGSVNLLKLFLGESKNCLFEETDEEMRRRKKERKVNKKKSNLSKNLKHNSKRGRSKGLSVDSGEEQVKENNLFYSIKEIINEILGHRNSTELNRQALEKTDPLLSTAPKSLTIAEYEDFLLMNVESWKNALSNTPAKCYTFLKGIVKAFYLPSFENFVGGTSVSEDELAKFSTDWREMIDPECKKLLSAVCILEQTQKLEQLDEVSNYIYNKCFFGDYGGLFSNVELRKLLLEYYRKDFKKYCCGLKRINIIKKGNVLKILDIE